MKIFLLLFIFSVTSFAQNIDRVRLHQEMDFLTNGEVTENKESAEQAASTENLKENSDKPIAKDDLEQNYFQDQVKTKKAATKRQK